MLDLNIKKYVDRPPVFDQGTYLTEITEEEDVNLPKRILKVLFLFFCETNLLFCFFRGKVKKIVSFGLFICLSGEPCDVFYVLSLVFSASLAFISLKA